GAAGAALDLHVRRDRTHLLKRGDVAALQKLRADGGNRDGNILQVLLATLGGHDDLAHVVGIIKSDSRSRLGLSRINLRDSLRSQQSNNGRTSKRIHTRTYTARHKR